MRSGVIFLSEVSHWKGQFKEFTVRRNKNLLDEVKKHRGHVLTYNSKNFDWLNKQLDLERTMNGLGKPFRKKSDPKNRKTEKIKAKLPHVNKKSLARKRIFVQTPFSHSTLKLQRKKFTPQNHSLFRSTFCFGVTKITTPIWHQKSWKSVNRSWKKKDSAPIQVKFFEL